MINATIDIGTNSVLLLVASCSSPLPPAGEGSGVRVLLDEARITGLGRGLEKKFHPQSVERTLKALQEFDSLCKKEHVEKVFCVGTAAFRKAQDGTALMEKIKNQFGWETKIISGEEEARLSSLSVERDFLGQYQNLVALDIGGGSTEVSSPGSKVQSLSLGTVDLTERFLKSDPPKLEEISSLCEEIRNILSFKLKAQDSGLRTLVALAGTATTLSAINQKLKEWDPKKIQGSVIKRAELKTMIDLLRRSTHEERRRIVGMVPGREETLLAGSLILEAILENLSVDRVIVSDRGLRYGLFYQEFSNA